MSSKNLIPKERIEKAEYETERNERIESMIPKLKKRLPILFWTAIISTIVGFFSDNSLGDTLPTQYSIGYVIQSICALAYGISLLIISTESDFYKTAGILKISSLLCSQIASILTIFTVSWILIILAIAVAALALYGEYNEFKGHAKILEETNPLLSDNWDKLRIGSVICYGALIASIIFACVSSILGAFIAVVASIGILVVGILKLFYLYKTSATFKNL